MQSRMRCCVGHSAALVLNSGSAVVLRLLPLLLDEAERARLLLRHLRIRQRHSGVLLLTGAWVCPMQCQTQSAINQVHATARPVGDGLDEDLAPASRSLWSNLGTRSRLQRPYYRR